ncbi:MAG: sulfate permease [Syntrophobacteria bacterium]
MTTPEKSRSNPREFLRSMLPIIAWLPSYKRAWLRTDIMAGLAVWAMTVPQALAYAGIAGVPPVYGLYTVPLAMVAYAFFGTSRTLCAGPESAIAIISAVTVGALALGNPNEFIALTSLLALVVGVLFLLFGLLRLGWLANFLAQPVLQGFIQGIALIVIIGQVPTLFGTEATFAQLVENMRNLPQLIGLKVDYTGFLLQSWAVLATLGKAHLPTTAVGVGALALLFAFKLFRPNAPSALIAVILSVLAVSVLGLADRGVSVIGEVETGMVAMAVPAVSIDKVVALLPGALAIVLLGYSVSLGVAAVGAQTTGEKIDSNQELVGLGVANLGAAFSSGFVVCGSLSRGSVILRAGGKTQIVCLINAGLVVLTLVFALPLFFKLPKATLSAIVIQALSGLLNFAYFRRLLRINREEFAYAMAALFGVLLLGILQGVALGVVLALVVLIRRVSRPATAVLGRLPGTDDYRDIDVHPEAEALPGLLIFRFDAPVIFPNVGYFADEVRRLIAEAATPIREVLIPAQQINQLDSTGADQLAKLQAELLAKGIAFSFAEAKSALREAMGRTGLEEKIGADHFYESIEDGVQAFFQRQEHQVRL